MEILQYDVSGPILEMGYLKFEWDTWLFSNPLSGRMCIGHKMRLRSHGSGSTIISCRVGEILRSLVGVLMFRVSVALLCYLNSNDSC
jgi:hypothetical protein